MGWNQEAEASGLMVGAATTQEVSKARVLVVDDHPIMREALAEMLNRQEDIFCCGTAGTLGDARTAIVEQRPDLLLLDLRLGAADGLESIKALKAEFMELRIL